MRKGSIAAIAAALIGLIAPVGAHPNEPHGMPEGLDRLQYISRQPADGTTVKENFQVVGRLKLRGRAPEGDIYYYRQGRKRTAVIGTWANPCTGRGANIVDVSDPSAPRLLSHARLGSDGFSYEDVVVTRIGKRDVLATGVQSCDGQSQGGLALFDITRRSRPERLAFIRTTAVGVHELDVAVRPDGTVLALLAVPFATEDEGDFQIVDITNPEQPDRVAGWSVINDSSLPIPSMSDPSVDLGEITQRRQGKGETSMTFGHSVRGADDGMTAYVSHWDSGTLKFDISNPASPVLVSRTTVPFDQELDAHSVNVFDAGGHRYLLENSEDFLPSSPARITSSVTGTDTVAGAQQIWMLTRLDQVGPVTAELHDAGEGCEAADYEGSAGKIVLANSGRPTDELATCTPAEQVVLAAAADPAALLLNGLGPTRPESFWAFPLEGPNEAFDVEGLPVVAMWDREGFAERLRSAPPGQGAQVTLDPAPPAWGWINIYDESQGQDEDGDGVTELEPVGEFSDLPLVVGDDAYTEGVWSVHNNERMGDRVYASWYAHGIVALDMTDPTAPALVGQYSDPSLRRQDVFDVVGGGGNVASTWGVAVDPARGLIYASDMRTGLWILRPTGPAAPTS